RCPEAVIELTNVTGEPVLIDLRMRLIAANPDQLYTVTLPFSNRGAYDDVPETADLDGRFVLPPGAHPITIRWRAQRLMMPGRGERGDSCGVETALCAPLDPATQEAKRGGVHRRSCRNRSRRSHLGSELSSTARLRDVFHGAMNEKLRFTLIPLRPLAIDPPI